MLKVKLPIAIIALAIPPIEEDFVSSECIRYTFVYSEEELSEKLHSAWQPGASGYVYSANFKKGKKLDASKNRGLWL